MAATEPKNKGLAQLTWFGTNAFRLDTPLSSLLIDPFKGFAGGTHPIDANVFFECAAEAVPKDIIITHGHFDHIATIPEIMSTHPCLVYCTECVTESLQESGCNPQNIITIQPGNTFTFDDICIRVNKGKHIKFDLSLVARTLSPANLKRASKNIRQTIELLRRYPEEGQTVFYDVYVTDTNDSPEQANPNQLHIQFLGSLSLDDDIEYETGADYLVLPYQGNTHLERHAESVIRHLKPKRIVASHFDDSFPPLTTNVDTQGLRHLVESEFPGTELNFPDYEMPMLLNV